MRRDLVRIFVGIKNHVVALNSETGDEIWRAKLKGSDFVSVLWDGEVLMAANAGEVFRLDPRSGAVIWNNKMKGMGLGVVSLASERLSGTASAGDVAPIKKKKNDEAAAAAAAG